ncbi:MAG TPA: ABC transporter ATP-binding protein [Polyangiaceae bacterium]|nr:ABC transporter ATP-binding protein [Polyangiaceae bacterium]
MRQRADAALPPSSPVSVGEARAERAPAIQLQGVSKRYGSLLAVDAVDLELQAGQALGLIGPNGAGKSSLIELMSGLAAANGGRVSVAGGDPTQPTVRRKIGFAPQALAVYGDLSVAENLSFFARLYGLRGAALTSAVQGALGLVQLSAQANRRANVLSGGMQRRLNLACAVVHRPQVVLLDEPSVGIDAECRAQVLAGLRELKRTGVTLVWSTHRLEEVEALCDRVAVLDGGKLVAFGGVAEVKASRDGGQAACAGDLAS